MGARREGDTLSLTSIEDAIERWPYDDYPSDTLGGWQRDWLVRVWELADELPPEAAVVMLEHFGAQWAALVEIQDTALRSSFPAVMGYELPVGLGHEET